MMEGVSYEALPIPLRKTYEYKELENGEPLIAKEEQYFPRCFTNECPLWYYNINTRCWQCKQADALYSLDDGGNKYVQEGDKR